MVDGTSILHVKQTDEGVLRLTMDDQRTRNALSEGMMQSFNEEITKASSNDFIRVIVIASNGPVFSAGHDLKKITQIGYYFLFWIELSNFDLMLGYKST